MFRRLRERWNRLPGVYTLAVCVVLGICMGLFISNHLLTRAYVMGDSMIPTYHEGDMVWVCRVATPERGSKVVVWDEEDQKDIIKRVIALPGETIQIEDNVVYVDGKILEEDYLNDCGEYYEGIASDPVELGEGEYFVMGDNREVSRDSRVIGPIESSDIIGVVIG